MNRTTLNPTGITNGRPFHVHDEQAAKRERILAAALKLFAHEPYQAVTMDRVAAAAQVAKGTLYLYFPSKDALYLGVLSDGLDTAYRTYQSSADPKLPVVERLRRSIAVMVEFYDQRRDCLQFFRVANRRRNPRRRLHSGRSAPGDVHHPGRDSLAAALLRCRPPGLRAQPRSRQPDDPIARRGTVAAQAGTSAMIRTPVRRAIRLAILAGVALGFYFFGRAYLWPPEDRSTIKVVGMIEAPEVNITSRIAGRIKQLDLLEGDHVTKGQVVAWIE